MFKKWKPILKEKEEESGFYGVFIMFKIKIRGIVGSINMSSTLTLKFNLKIKTYTNQHFLFLLQNIKSTLLSPLSGFCSQSPDFGKYVFESVGMRCEHQ